jgi:secreted trypsin-like serine protease
MILFCVGGSEVDDIADFPYQLSLRILSTHVCGASIIHCHWALTAGIDVSLL